MSDIFDQLISGSKQNAPQPELLETLGKKAAAQFLQNGDSLNETIVKLASEHGNLENEHVKRIAEFANNAVFQGLHSQNADKNVHFAVADPGTIIQDLRDGGSPAFNGRTLGGVPRDGGPADYQNPPPNVANTDGFADQASGMAELDRRNQTSGVMGAGEQIAKTASYHGFNWSSLDHANPVENVFAAHLRLRATREKLAHTHESFDLGLQDAREDFYRNVKGLVLDVDGMGFPDVINAVKLAAPNDSFAFQILRPVAERLVKEGAIKNTEMKKTASQKMLNFNHPLITSFLSIVKLAEEKVRSKAALDEVDLAMTKTSAFLKANVQ